MKQLIDHPVYVAQQERYDSIRSTAGTPEWRPIEISQLAVQMRHLLQLDPQAVYHEVGGCPVIYYRSDDGKYVPGTCTRIVLGTDGKIHRIGRVHFDPRRAA